VAALGLHDNFGFFMLIRVSPIVPTRVHSITVINDMTAVWAIPAPCFCNQFLYLVMPLQVVSHGLQQKEHIGAGSQVNVKENLKTVKLNSSFNFLFRIVIRV